MEKQTQPVADLPVSEVNVSEGAAPAGAPKKSMNKMALGVYGLLVVLGVGTGYLLSRSPAGKQVTGAKTEYINTGKVAGVSDEKTFKDSAVGTVEKGGMDGEGTHKLVREGGESQTAFLISSVVDLDQYVGKKVKVWGQTFAAEKASWLMDVGKIEMQE